MCCIFRARQTRIDPAFLNSAAYPVTLDPTVTFTTDYAYDNLYRLTCIDPNSPIGSCAAGAQISYGYDPVGNRTSQTTVGGTVGSTFDRADRILSAGNIGYSVNPNGNLTARGADAFAYDQTNRLTSATVAGTTSTAVY